MNANKQENKNDGQAIRSFIKLFNENEKNSSSELLMIILSLCYHSNFLVPCNVYISDADKERFMNANIGDTVTPTDNIRMKPDILQSGDELFFPIFTNCEQMGDDYSNHFSKIEMDFPSVMENVSARGDLSGIVIDAFTSPFVISKDTFEIIKELERKNGR